MIKIFYNEHIIYLKNQNETNIDNFNKNINKLEEEYNYKIKDIQSLHNKEIEDYKQKLTKLNKLNSNLLRIARERANQDRNLRPKKAHSGFLILLYNKPILQC